MPTFELRALVSAVMVAAAGANGMFLNLRSAQAGNKVSVGTAVPAARQISMDQIDHSDWNRLLREYVDGNGIVDYRGMKSSTSALQTLKRYLNRLSAASTSQPASRASQLAFWINAYNAVTVHGILREYPTSSIRNHTAKLVGYNIWHDLQLSVGGRLYSLDQIEHKVLRPMGDPRIHFAIVCASIGCPRLLNEAYVTERVENQLDLNARDFFSRSQNFRHDLPERRFYLSSILSWFGQDFGKSRADQLRRISRWLPTPAAQQAARQNAVSVSFLDYDWTLNGN